MSVTAAVVASLLLAAPCPPERCETDCLAGSPKACVAAAGVLQASNPLKAAALLQRACNAEEGAACAELATTFRLGRGVPADQAQARLLDVRACALKVATSCLELGRAEEKQAGLARSAAETSAGMARSAGYLGAGCDGKIAAACTEAARLYAAGAGVKIDNTLAAKLARQGCELGDKAGCRYLAWFLEEGLGGKRDLKRSTELLKANADARPLPPPPICEDAPALLSFESATPGVEVWVDGLLLGSTPTVARLSPGAHLLVGRAPRREPLRVVLDLARGQRGRQPVEWPAQLGVESAPAGASVLLDGKPLGVTPLSASLDGGAYELNVTLSGYEPERRVVAVPQGEAKLERFELRAQPGQVQLSSEPSGAQLELDGKPMGTTPWVGVLPPGPHRARVTLERYLRQEQTLSVQRGVPLSVIVALKPDPQFAPSKLLLESTPPGASVSVDGAVVGTTPWEGEVAKGPHEIELALEGYQVERRRMVASNQPWQLKPRLKALPRVDDQPVVLSVSSTPSGAVLTLAGKRMGKTPWTGRVLPGAHEVSLSLPGHAPYTDLATAPGTVEATLAPLPSGFRLAATPSPADLEVRVDEQLATAEAGLYPAAAGRHVVELRAAGFLPAKTLVKIPLGQVATVSLKLTPAPVVPRQGLRITSQPAGAEVSLNDTKAGLTPFESLALPPGPQRVTVALAGYQPITTSLEVKKKEVTEYQAALVALPVSVAIESTPPGARLFLDGEDKGVTPVMLLLEPRQRRVYLVLEGYETVDELRDTLPASAPKWSWVLKANAAPPPPPPQMLDAGVPALFAAGSENETMRVLLADLTIDPELKRTRLTEYSKGHEDLTEPIAAAAPAALKDELCVTWASRVRGVRYQGRALDSFGNEQPAQLFVNGKRFAQLPFDGNLPWCARLVEARDGERTLSRQADKPLDATQLNTDAFEFPGRKRRVSFTAFGEAGFTPLLDSMVLSLSQADLQMFNPGFGVRFDFWGQIFHLSVAIKGSQLFKYSLFGDASLPLTPLGDLYLGLTVAAGSEAVRYRLSFDFGAWSLLCPSARLTNTLSIGERLFFTLTLDGAYVPEFLLPRLWAGTSLDKLWMLGGTFGVGVGF